MHNFFGREDRRSTDKLMTEMLSILNWSEPANLISMRLSSGRFRCHAAGHGGIED